MGRTPPPRQASSPFNNLSNSAERDTPVMEQTPPQKRAAIYAYSASQDPNQNIATDTQIHECLEYAQEQGYQVIKGQTYQEEVGDNNRPLLMNLREAAKLGLFDVLIVRNMNRISRRQVQVLEIIHELETLGIAIESVQEPLGTAVCKTMKQVIITMKVIG